MKQVRQNLFLFVCPPSDRGNGSEKPTVWRFHPPLSAALQVNPDARGLPLWIQHSWVCSAVKFLQLHTHTLHPQSCPQSNPLNGQDGGCKVWLKDEEWGVYGHFRASTGLVACWKQDASGTNFSCLRPHFVIVLNFFSFVHKIMTSLSKNLKKNIRSRHAYLMPCVRASTR